MTRENRQRVTAFYHYEITSFDKAQTATHAESFQKVPFESQCRKALRDLLSHIEKNRTCFPYIRSPFGLVDASGVRRLIDTHEKLQLKRRMLQEKKRLTKVVVLPHSTVTISNDQEVDFFTNNGCVKNFLRPLTSYILVSNLNPNPNQAMG